MPSTLISIDLTRSPEEQDLPLHNRWHPEIPPVAEAEPGEVFRVECLDSTGGQIANDDDASDVQRLDLPRTHYLSGPIAVRGAEPGDLLVVEVLDIGTLPGAEWGFTGICARENGGGLLADHYPEARKAIWDLDGVYATSRHLPGVRIAGMMHPGIIGCTPSHELLERWNQRECKAEVVRGGSAPRGCTDPTPTGACLGQLSGERYRHAAQEAARTTVPREHGGRCDLRYLSRGARAFLPVLVPGANLSVGDLHFSVGDGRITFCGAIEMAGWISLRVELIRGGMARFGTGQPIFEPGPIEPQYERQLVFSGISVDENGRQRELDPYTAYRSACLSAIRYLTAFGYTEEQAYLLLGAAPVESRIIGLVDHPNAVCSVALPLDIFEFDIRPDAPPPARLPDRRLAHPQ